MKRGRPIAPPLLDKQERFKTLKNPETKKGNQGG